jgi:endonuclease G
MSRNMQFFVALAVLVIVLLAAWLLFSSRNYPPGEPENAPPAAETNINLLMGNPSGATEDENHPDNYLMRKPYFVLSYNNANGTPNWVSWCLRETELGNAPRWPQFYPDDDLPRSFKHVKPGDYNGSGFDRGHMCPSGDRSTEESAKATFVMTNIIPQSPNCNQRAWADLEEHCRDLVRKKHQTLYIVSGPQGQGGEGKEGSKDAIGRRAEVAVPAKCWKVVLALEDGMGNAADVGRVGRDSRVFAVVMPNDQSVGHGWAKYRTSARDVEDLTGYHFFDRVPADVIDPLKARVDREHIPPPRHRRGDE